MIKWLQVLILFCVVNSTFAVEVTDLYQAKVEVNTQSSRDRAKAIKAAMRSVIVKVGGQPSALEHKLLQQAVARYNQFLTQYTYERDNDGLYLVAAFNESKINTLFQQANLPLWGNLRPQILVWLVDEQGLNRTILSESHPSFLPQQIVSFSSARGLPLILPLMDLEDQLSVNIADIWGRFSQATKRASARYFVDASLIIRISDSSLIMKNQTEIPECEGVLCQQTSDYVLDWSLVAERQQFSQSYHGTDKQVLLNLALQDVAGVIHQQYASSTELSNELIIDVANVDSLTTYVDVVNFLTDLSTVESLTLLEAAQEKRTFKLTLLGSKQALLASLKLNDVLQQYIDPLAAKDDDKNPTFYWRR